MSYAYPCPCRCSGQLIPITLTDAFGCEQCHKIFAVKPDGYTLEQLSTSYPQPPSWYWSGQHWHPAHYRPGKRCRCVITGLTGLCLVPILTWLAGGSSAALFLLLVTLGLAIIPAFVAWSALSRR